MTTRSPAAKRPFQQPSQETLDRLKLTPEVGFYLATRRVKLPTCPPKIKTPEPWQVPGAVFDPARVDKVLKAFRRLRHTKGRWAGRPLEPDPWQIAYILAPVFGWVRWDAELGEYVRIIKQLYVEVPRKNGKSTLIGGILIYLTCADGEEGAEVVAAATSVKQARYVFDPVKQLATKSPALAEHVKPLARRIQHPASSSYMEVVSSVAQAMHGGNIHGGGVDELHLHRSPDLLEAIESGTGSRSQPLVMTITTADAGEQGTIYARRRKYVESLAARTFKDPSQYGVIWAADATDPPFAEATQKKANPGFGISPTRQYMREAATKARNSPADLSSYLRLHLDIRTKQETKYIDLTVWDRNAGLVDEKKLRGRQVYGGLDLASTSDLCALCWDFPNEDGSHDLLWRHWCPEKAFDQLNERTSGEAAVWRRQGLLKVTPGDVADYGFIRAQINLDREAFEVLAVGYDRWNASSLVTELQADGANMAQVGQGYRDMSPPTKQIKQLLLEGTAKNPRYRHGGNPLVRWQIDNFAVSIDAAANVKPDKEHSGDKIDGLSAAVDAMAMTMTIEAPKKSKYETADGLTVLGQTGGTP